MRSHQFTLSIQWDKPDTEPSSPRDPLLRRHTISHPGKQAISGSAATSFHGEADRWNPEEMLLAALSQCHMLTFFYLAGQEGLTVTDYADTPVATLETYPDGSGNITDVVLKPRVSVKPGFSGDIEALHERAHELCFIARSVNFPVRHEVTPVTIT